MRISCDLPIQFRSTFFYYKEDVEGYKIIHETEIKQFGNRNGRNRVEIISTLGHKSRIVETDYEGRNELRGSKRIIKVEMDYVVRALTD